MSATLTRRGALLSASAAAGGGLLASACSPVLQTDRLTMLRSFHRVLTAAEGWNYHAQRFLLGRDRLAPEYPASAISRVFKPNGTWVPGGGNYARATAEGFAGWTLAVDGAVEHPLLLSLAQLRLLPARTQITRHDCVEGWSAIGQWSGPPVGMLLRAAGVKPQARFAVFHCADNLSGEPDKGGVQSPGQYYESLDLADARHPQTILAHSMNGAPLPVPHGAPLRLRVERQLGYKHAKYVRRIELVESFAAIAGGKGGYWEDRGYEWYAGI